MREGALRIPVYILEESDLAGVDDDARVAGTLQDAAKAIEKVLPRGRAVQVGLKHDNRRGTVPVAIIDSKRIEVGGGVAFHPSFPGGSILVDPALLVGDEVDEEPHGEDPRPVPSMAVPEDRAGASVPAPAKRAAKKKATADA